MRPLPAREPDTDRQWMIGVAPDRHLRFDIRRLLAGSQPGRPRVEVRVGQRDITRGGVGHGRAGLPASAVLCEEPTSRPSFRNSSA
jgi:hypothetical protein